MDVRGPDGKVTRFPDGTDDATVHSVMSSIYTPKPAAAAPPKSASGIAYDASDLAASKFTFGLSDKVGAAGSALGHTLMRAVTGKDDGGTFGSDYDKAVAQDQTKKAAYVAAHPAVDWATLPLNFLAGGAARTGLSAVRAGIASGAVAGAAGGAGHSSGSVGDQAAQIALSAGAGAVTGGVVGRYAPAIIGRATGAVQGGLGRVAQAVAPNSAMAARATQAPASLGALATPTANKARAYIADRLAADGTDPSAMAAQMVAAKARGVPYAPMDSGPNMQRAAAAIARKSGPGSKIVTDAVATRQAAQGERVQGAITRDLGPTVGVATEAQRLEDTARTAAQPLYDQAYAAGAVDHPTITALMQHPEMQAALDAGKQIHANDTFMANAKGETPPEPLVDGFPDVRTLDYTKRALDRKIDSAYSGDAAAKMQLPFLKDLRSTLTSSLDTAVPAYAAARKAYAGPMAMSEALQAGRAAASKTGDDIAAETASYGPAELEHYKLGLRSALSDAVDARVGGADKMKALIGTPKKEKALQQMFSGPGLDNFTKTLGDEGATSATFSRVTGNSKTAENTLDDADLAGVGKAVGAAVHMSGGNPLPALKFALSHLGDKLSGEAGQKMRAQVATLITETNPEIARELVAAAAKKNSQSIVGRKAVPMVAGAAGRASGASLGALTGNRN